MDIIKTEKSVELNSHVNSGNWQRNLIIVFAGQYFSLLGSQIVQFSIIWWMAKSTGSATILSFSAIAGILPMVLFGPFIGVFIDRWNRTLIMIFSDLFIAFCTIILILLFLMNIVHPWHIYILLFLRSIAGTFHGPAFQATFALMVPTKHLTRISGLQKALEAAINIGSPPLGALLVSLMSMTSLLSIDIATCLIAVLSLLVVNLPRHYRESELNGSIPSVLSDFKDGITFVISWKGLLALCIVWASINFLLGPASSLLPLMVTRYYGQKAGLLAAIEMSFGVGILIGGVVLGVWKGFNQRIVTTLLGIIGFGIAIFVFGLSAQIGFQLGLISVFFAGAMITIADGPIMAMVLSLVPQEKQGRVLTIMGSVATAAIPIGLIISGPLADKMGISFIYLISGVACIIIGIGSFFVPVLMSIESHGSRPDRTDGREDALGATV